MKKIDKEKCKAWIDLIIAIIIVSKELNDSEFEYIKLNLLKLKYEKEIEKMEVNYEKNN